MFGELSVGLLGLLFMGFLTVGLIFTFDGLVRLCVGKKTGPWREGGASLLAGGIIAAVPVLIVSSIGMRSAWTWFSWFLLIAGLVLASNGGVQLCVRKKRGLWKDGGGSLLAGVVIAGVSVFVVWLAKMYLRLMWAADIWSLWFLFIAGVVLALNGAVQLSVRNKTGHWQGGGTSSLAGVIIVGGALLAIAKGAPANFLLVGFLIAGLVLAFNAVGRLRVGTQTGAWEEGVGRLSAGVLIVWFSVWGLPGLLWGL